MPATLDLSASARRLVYYGGCGGARILQAVPVHDVFDIGCSFELVFFKQAAIA